LQTSNPLILSKSRLLQHLSRQIKFFQAAICVFGFVCVLPASMAPEVIVGSFSNSIFQIFQVTQCKLSMCQGRGILCGNFTFHRIDTTLYLKEIGKDNNSISLFGSFLRTCNKGAGLPKNSPRMHVQDVQDFDLPPMQARTFYPCTG